MRFLLTVNIILVMGSAFFFFACREAKGDPVTTSIEENQPNDPLAMSFEEYSPVSTLVVSETEVKRAKYPFVDVHNHQWSMATQDLKGLAAEMDELNMRVMVNLSGRTRGDLKDALDNVNRSAANRFIVFANVDFDDIGKEGWTESAVRDLENDVKNGANGLKIYKNLGLTLRDTEGKRVPTDDPRIAPIWDKCGELGIPVLIHTGEPVAFFDNHDKYNERWLELKQFPNRARPADQYPPWEQVMQEQWNMFSNHPNTKFIDAHLGWLGNDLSRFGALLDSLPNVYTEFAAAIHELGRQPRNAREFFIKYQDRIMFGKDTYRPEEYYTYFRLLESDDEYFPYFRKRHAFWRLYGLDLPDEVLKKVYYKNALNVIPNIDKTLFPE